MGDVRFSTAHSIEFLRLITQHKMGMQLFVEEWWKSCCHLYNLMWKITRVPNCDNFKTNKISFEKITISREFKEDNVTWLCTWCFVQSLRWYSLHAQENRV